ncbi:SANT and BTB domain regulator of class switch recombination isoform X1 [Leptinotarsa decemlineata]|uniref:SANT and BTB domain regulator of class switch recombination isoform X1 n=1 Tax=Leptinotarsa decemlineata TaxID=7539 RepID=UPI003D3051F3
MESGDKLIPDSPIVELKNKKQEGNVSHISIKEFLNFLKTAYQVQDSVEGILISGGMSEAVNWLKRKENQMILKKNSICCQTSDIYLQEDKKEVVRKQSVVSCLSDADPLKMKLNEVLSEGLLDSVLPYLVQNVTSSKKSLPPKGNDRTLNSQSGALVHVVSSEKIVSRRRSSDVVLKTLVSKTDSEVEIHVCDEVKNTKKTFFCNQNLLVGKMGYFAEVTQGQRLEDMDISVHCDIGIFEWLMQWVKRDSLNEGDTPHLDPQCVIPILVSAAFLQMEPLLNTCLLFCHEHLNEILRTSTNLSCLNDSVLTRLAAMYTNTEVEAIKDRKDKIQSRLFTKLIQSLAEPEPESVRGHWCSLARVFQCEKCQLLITPDVAAKIPCIPQCMRLQPDGSVISLHIRDPSWNINAYILKLQKQLKTWRKIYWRLWGDAHFLFCVTCKRYFPSNQIGWCRFHPDTPQFFTLDAQKAPLPIGRFPCCGERAYRFQLLENFSGCQFRQHMVCTEDVKDSAIFSMLESYRHLIEEEPPQLLFPERLTRLVARDPATTEKKFICKEIFWWDGLEIIPPRPKLGLLSSFANRVEEDITEEDSSDEVSEEEFSSLSSSDSEEGSVECNPPRNEVVRKKKKRNTESKMWQHNLSARSNQDVQRAYEENAVKQMTAILNRNVINENVGRSGKSTMRNAIPLGGIWVRLETDWRETQNSLQPKTKNVFTAGKYNKFKGK